MRTLKCCRLAVFDTFTHLNIGTFGLTHDSTLGWLCAVLGPEALRSLLFAKATLENALNNEEAARLNNFESLKNAWAEEMSSVVQKMPWMGRLARGEVSLCHYQGFLLETYLNTGLNPQLQAFSTLYFKGNPRQIIRKYFQHAISEIGHDLLAKADLVNLGVSEEVINKAKPQPETEAIFGYFVYLVQFRNPICYLGYLFHLEFSPTVNGPKYIEMLRAKGVPENALTFLHEHATVDIQHNKMMEAYIQELVKTPEDLQLVIESMRAAVRLHSLMLSSAFENGERLFGAKISAA